MVVNSRFPDTVGRDRLVEKISRDDGKVVNLPTILGNGVEYL